MATKKRVPARKRMTAEEAQETEGGGTSLPYLPSYKNVEKLFDKIKAAKQPSAFTQKFLYETLGLKTIADRALVSFLRTLGFLDAGNRPTSEYSLLKNDKERKRAVGRAVKRAYAPLFAANENANTLSSEDLRGLVGQVAGADSGTTTKILGTLSALLKLGEFSENVEAEESEADEAQKEVVPEKIGGRREAPRGSGAHPEFHFNIQVHLPADGSEATYLNIFNAIRRVFT